MQRKNRTKISSRGTSNDGIPQQRKKERVRGRKKEKEESRGREKKERD